MPLLDSRFGLVKAVILLSIGLAMVVGLVGRHEAPNKPAPGTPPAAAYSAQGFDVAINRAPDGHFWLDADVNGTPVRFLVDTGASHVILTEDDAERIGFHLSKQDFTVSYATANGATGAAPVRLDAVEVGDIRVRNVVAAVNGAAMPQSLLGMSFLERLSGFEVEGDRLILKR